MKDNDISSLKAFNDFGVERIAAADLHFNGLHFNALYRAAIGVVSHAEHIPIRTNTKQRALGDLQHVVAKFNHNACFHTVAMTQAGPFLVRRHKVDNHIHPLFFDAQRLNFINAAGFDPAQIGAILPRGRVVDFQQRRACG